MRCSHETPSLDRRSSWPAPTAAIAPPVTELHETSDPSPPLDVNFDAVDVGVVIVTFNNAAHVDALIDSLPAACTGLSWTAVAVDNDSTDGSVEMLEARGVKVLRMGRNAGYAAGLNVGIRYLSNARSVLVTNPDIVLYPGSILPASAVLEDDRVGIVSPQLRSFDGQLGMTQRRTPTALRLIGMTFLGPRIGRRSAHLSDVIDDPQAYLWPQDLDWCVGALMLVSRQCIEAVGPWDESFFLYSEETDYCQRAVAAGFKVRYIPIPAGAHEGGGGVFQPRLRSMMAVNRVRLYSRTHSRAAAYTFFAVAIAFEGSRAMTGNKAAREAVQALIRPSKRPIEIQCSDSLLPR